MADTSTSSILSISGLASNIDWQSIISELQAADTQQLVTPLQTQQQTQQAKLSAWQGINTNLLSLKTAADAINQASDFNLYTTSVSSNTSTNAADVLSATTNTNASPGTYQIVVSSLASAQKLASSSFTSQDSALNLSGGIIVGGQTVTISSTDTLADISDKLNAADAGSSPSGVTASIVNYGTNGYRLLLTSDSEGSAGISLSNSGSADLIGGLGFVAKGLTGDVANTSSGAAISSSTLIKNIDGYNYTSGDTITLTGTSTSGGTVNSTFQVTDTTTIGNLLNTIQNQYGNVTASVTSDGKISIADNVSGDSNLSVTLTPNNSTLKLATANNFGTISTIGPRQIQAGADANFTVDGYPVTSSSNTVSDVIPGVTLNLEEAAPDTTITLTVGRDLNSVTNLINNFVSAYNTVMDAINTQQTYNTTTNQTGGPLFGDNTLQNIKYNLRNTILSPVSGVNSNFSTIGLIGISIGTDGKLTTDNTKLQGYLQTNFNDLENLFISNSSSTSSNLTYVGDTNDTQPGTYNVQVTGVNPVAGYFANQGDASGHGGTLTGTSGNAKGLSVNYSGTATGSIGSMTLTFGVAELLDRALYSITDPTNGYLPDAEQTIQNSITNYTQEITKNQNQITQQMTTLQNKFVTMETALAQLQNQSTWLTGQINTLSSGWQFPANGVSTTG